MLITTRLSTRRSCSCFVIKSRCVEPLTMLDSALYILGRKKKKEKVENDIWECLLYPVIPTKSVHWLLVVPANAKLAYVAEAIYLGDEPFSYRADLRVSKDSSQAGWGHPCSHWHSQHKHMLFICCTADRKTGPKPGIPRRAHLSTLSSPLGPRHLSFACSSCLPSQLSFRVFAHTITQPVCTKLLLNIACSLVLKGE